MGEGSGSMFRFRVPVLKFRFRVLGSAFSDSTFGLLRTLNPNVEPEPGTGTAAA
jgi:hypothetical protein